MSVKEYNDTIILIDGLNGQIIDSIDKTLYSEDTIFNMIKDVVFDYVFTEHRGLIIKNGFKN